ncbi:type III effector protein chaperone [Ralstonia solanacearum]|nr:type III effector protein chaperone [Ralstonia solanacearum]
MAPASRSVLSPRITGRGEAGGGAPRAGGGGGHDGGVVLNGTLVTVTPMPLEGLAGEAGDGALVVSATLGCRVGALDARALCALFAHAPGVLAVYNAAIGCQPNGELVLHRMVPVHDAVVDTLAQDLVVTQQLAVLLGDAATQVRTPQ